MSQQGRRGGNALIEFSLLGVPVIFITISIVAMGINMWVYQNLAYSVDATARYISMHGFNCSQNSNSCTLTIAQCATFFQSQALALDPSKVNVTFTDGSGGTSCNPVNTCTGTAQFPASSYNRVDMDVTVSATYTLKNPIALYWPPDRDSSNDFTVGAISKQRIVF